jgi:hypothetical protein
MSDLTLMQAHTIADALTSFALQPDSTDTRIREVISALQAIGYTDTAATLERLNEHSVKA